MFTVLIIPGSSMKSYMPYHSLLASAVYTGRLGVCEWYENAKCIEDAVPDLLKLVENKLNWRAIVVCPEKLEDDIQFKVDTINPFEYASEHGIVNINGEAVDASPALVRLTHLLTGVIPAYKNDIPEMYVEYPDQSALTDESFADDSRLPTCRVVIQEKDEETAGTDNYNDALRQLWMNSHTINVSEPTEIILVKTRAQLNEDDQLKQLHSAWQNHSELESSEFWKRNLYADQCRFLVFDLDQKGNLQKQNGLFRLWNSVLILIENRLDTDMLKTKRLYHLDCQIDRNELKTVFQNAAGRLNSAHYALEKSIRIESREHEESEGRIPDYQVDVNVETRPVGFDGIYLQSGRVRLAEKGVQIDIDNWDSYVLKSQDDLKSIAKAVNRDIDKSANHSRYFKEFLTDEVKEISQFTNEDLKDDLQKRFRFILKSQKELPKALSEKNDAIAEYDEKVKSMILRRMNLSQIHWLIGILVTALLFMFVCALLSGKNEMNLVYIGVSAAAALLTLYGMLLYQRSKLVEMMREYEGIITETYDEIADGATKIASVLSEAVSHIKGASYLRILEQKRNKRNSSFYEKQRKMKAVERFLDALSKWNEAMQVDANMNHMEESLNTKAADFINDRNTESLIALDFDKWKRIPVNHSGLSVLSPYSFITKLTVERIAVYDHLADDADSEVTQ